MLADIYPRCYDSVGYKFIHENFLQWNNFPASEWGDVINTVQKVKETPSLVWAKYFPILGGSHRYTLHEMYKGGDTGIVN